MAKYIVQYRYDFDMRWRHDTCFDNEPDARDYMNKVRAAHEGYVPHRLLVVIEEFE